MLRWTGHPPSQAAAADGADLQSARLNSLHFGDDKNTDIWGLGYMPFWERVKQCAFFWCRREGRVGDGAGKEVALMF